MHPQEKALLLAFTARMPLRRDRRFPVSRSAWYTWLCCVIIGFGYGALSRQGGSFYLALGTGFVIGLIPLYLVDKHTAGRKKK